MGSSTMQRSGDFISNTGRAGFELHLPSATSRQAQGNATTSTSTAEVSPASPATPGPELLGLLAFTAAEDQGEIREREGGRKMPQN